MGDQDAAPFNMALNTLERLGGILTDIHKTAADGTLSPAQRQFIMVSHIKHFFSQACPLLEPKTVEMLSPKVLELNAGEISVNLTRNGTVIRTEKNLVFNQELEERLFNLLIEIQMELQKLKYFMPPRRDLGAAVGRVN